MKKFSPKEALEAIKALFVDTAAAGSNDPANELKDYATNEGVMLKIDKLEVGGKVFTADGTTAAPEGVHTLVDGTIVTTDAEGMITEVTVPAPDATQAAFNAMVAKFAAGTPEERITNLETMCKALMSANFQWKINETTREAIEAQAIAAFNQLSMPATFKAQFSAQEGTISKLEKALAASEAARAKDAANTKQAIDKVCDLIQKFAESASDDPAHTPKNKVEPKSTQKDNINQLAQTLATLKK